MNATSTPNCFVRACRPAGDDYVLKSRLGRRQWRRRHRHGGVERHTLRQRLHIERETHRVYVASQPPLKSIPARQNGNGKKAGLVINGVAVM